MDHLLMGSFLVTSLLSVASLTYAFGLWRQSRDPLVAFFLTVFAGLTCQTVVFTVLEYTQVAVKSVPQVWWSCLGILWSCTVFLMAHLTAVATFRILHLRRKVFVGRWLLVISLVLWVGSLFSVQGPATQARLTLWRLTFAWLPLVMLGALILGIRGLMAEQEPSRRRVLVPVVVATAAFFPLSVGSFGFLWSSDRLTLPVDLGSLVPFCVFVGVLSLVFAWFARHSHKNQESPTQLRPSGADFRGRGLSARESEVACLILEGKDNKSIARDLGISVNTVKTHAATVFRKLGVQSRFELVRFLRSNPSQG